jgi:hypothetical protein
MNIMNLVESEVQCPDCSVTLLASWPSSAPSRRQRPSSYPATDAIATFDSTTQHDLKVLAADIHWFFQGFLDLTTSGFPEYTFQIPR